MFRISITLTPVRITGLKALDKRRSLKLQDHSTLCVQGAPVCYPVGTDVNEAFARLHFDQTSTLLNEMVSLDDLTPDDVVDATGANFGAVKFRDDISPERICELFVAARSKRKK